MKIKRIYAWTGFIVFWSLIITIVWSMFNQDETIDTLVKIVEALK